jgi:hypothetical protein
LPTLSKALPRLNPAAIGAAAIRLSRHAWVIETACMVEVCTVKIYDEWKRVNVRQIKEEAEPAARLKSEQVASRDTKKRSGQPQNELMVKREQTRAHQRY